MAHGNVPGEDYDTVFTPAIEEKLKKHKKIRLLYCLGKDFSRYTVVALLDDAKVSTQYLARIFLPRTSCVGSIAFEPPRHPFPCDARSSSRKRSSNVSSSLSASCASGPMASSTTRSPQFKLAVSTSSKLAAEKFSSPLQIVIVLLNLITYRTNSAAGRACSPSLLTISTSLRMREKGGALDLLFTSGNEANNQAVRKAV